MGAMQYGIFGFYNMIIASRKRKKLSQQVGFWYISHFQAMKTQASLRICSD